MINGRCLECFNYFYIHKTERPKELIDTVKILCINCQFRTAKVGFLCGRRCLRNDGRALGPTWMTRKCISCKSEEEVLKSSGSILENWKCIYCRDRQIMVFDSAKRCSTCQNRIVKPNNNPDNDLCFKCVLFDIFKKNFNLPYPFIGSIQTIIDDFLISNDLNDKLSKFEKIINNLNSIFDELDLVFSNYAFVAKPLEQHSSFLDFLLDFLYYGEGKQITRKFSSLLDGYLGNNSYLRDKILKVCNEKEGFFVVEHNLKFSKPFVKWAEKGALLVLQFLNSDNLANQSPGSGKYLVEEKGILCFIGLISLYKLFVESKESIYSSKLYTLETNYQEIISPNI